MAQYDIILIQNVAGSGIEFTDRIVNLAKGSLISANGSQVPTVLAAGTNGYVLTLDSAETTGLKWAPAGASDTFKTLTFPADSGYTWGSSNVVASGTDTLDFVAGYGIAIDSDSTNKAIRIRATGSGGLSNAYGTMTDGTNNATASGADTFKFRSTDNKLSVLVTNNDGTHGDNLLLTINQGNIDHNSLSNYAANRHFLQTDIANISTALSTGLVKVTTGTGALSVVTDNSGNWDTAYGWGNHASAGYLTVYPGTGIAVSTGSAWGTSLAINNNTDNYVVTMTGTGFNGEANLIFNGTQLTVTGNVKLSTIGNRLVFGDDDSYFYESSDDQIMVYLAAADRWRFTTGQFRMNSNGGPSLQAENSSATNPVFCPINSDANTGLGGAASQLSLIISSTEMMRVTSSLITINTSVTGPGGESTLNNFKNITGRTSDSLLHVAGNTSLTGNLHLNYNGGAVTMFSGTAGSLHVTGYQEIMDTRSGTAIYAGLQARGYNGNAAGGFIGLRATQHNGELGVYAGAAIAVQADAGASAQPDNYAFYARAYGASGTANYYGLYVNVNTGGSGNAYAIYVNAGKVRLGLSSGTSVSSVGVDSSGNLITFTAGGSDSITLTPSPSTDHSATGIKVSLTAGETLVIGDVVYMKSDGKVWKADADATGLYPAIAIALAGASADASVEVLMKGIMRDDTWNWTVGGVIYLSTTAGALTQTAPTGSGHVVQVIGVATHADRMLFDPSLDLITLV